MVYSQQEILEKLRPALESEGAFYYKKRNILAKIARGGEQISTVTGDGLETTNKAEPGDYIVQNQTEAGEQYVVPAEEFLTKYELVGEYAPDAFTEYRPTGRIIALELTPERLKNLGLPGEFYFTTDWGQKMVAREGDFLGGPPDFSELYRLARKEFFETYTNLSKNGT